MKVTSSLLLAGIDAGLRFGIEFYVAGRDVLQRRRIRLTVQALI